MSVLPTVRVKGGPKGSRIINRSSFDPAIHELADAPARDPLDHDGDGRLGGSLKGEQSTVARGRKRKVN